MHTLRFAVLNQYVFEDKNVRACMRKEPVLVLVRRYALANCTLSLFTVGIVAMCSPTYGAGVTGIIAIISSSFTSYIVNNAVFRKKHG
jgi:hypothetical protein